ncbi:helix-turn-helix transcriptional regulator [Brevundimonas naejangsanensis]|uniref:helix-turn-helix transcriptional regulator n=1 Tax=Brevundimonas naejangsanensis TaxID=588932 RepID=UPI0026F0441A|nr:LuxR C-terminal-related transcriptional regulator [Brevundimonas naejangsanensis]
MLTSLQERRLSNAPTFGAANDSEDEAEALWLLSSDAEILDSNGPGRLLLDAGDIAVSRFGRFHLRGSVPDARFRRMLAAGTGGSLMVGRCEDLEGSDKLRVIRMPHSGMWVVILDRDDELHQRRLARLKELWSLTPKESAVLRLLSQGETLADISDHMTVALTTVRTHLRSLFAKSGVSRKADLVRIAMSGNVRLEPGF